MPKKITVLHILPNLSGGGAEKICLDIIKGLDRNIFEPALLLFKENGLGLTWKQELSNLNIPIYSLKKRGLIDLVNFYHIVKTIKQISPQVVHTHLGGDIYGRLAAKLLGCPVIVSTEHNLNHQERKIAGYFKRLSSPWVDKILAVSQAVKEDAITRYHLSPEKLSVVYNGIDLNFFQNNNYPRPNKPSLVIGSLGRLNTQKGYHILIQAASLTKNSNYQIKIAGQGENRTELQTLIKQLNLDGKIKLIGQVEAKSFLQQIDIFILPSLWEGLGIAALEAAAMKKPIIASYIDGLKEVVDDKSAWLCPPADPRLLAKQIDYLIDHWHSPEITAKVERAAQIIREKFDLQMTIVAYANIYLDILGQKKYENPPS